jgi:hypothetical protein
MDERLAAAGMTRTGAVTQPHLRPWATALKAPTSGGTVWLKAAGPGTAVEAPLYRLLQQVVPDHVLEPIAVDVARGWMLLPDGGPTLGERVAGSELVEALTTALPRYGQLQRDLAPHTDRLLSMGVEDMRPAVMPARFDEALAIVRGYVQRRGNAKDRGTYERAATMRATVAGWADRLAGAPGAPGLDHNDLHPWNMLAGPGGDLALTRFYDWGDSVVAHPFASMLGGLGFVRSHVLEAAADAPEIHRLRDAYLEVFDDLAPRAELVETLELACRLAKIPRTLIWNRALTAAGEEVEETWARARLESLAAMTEASYLAGG